MSTIAVRFVLDGNVLTTTRGSVSRFLNPGRFECEEAYYFQEGRIMSPDELTVGEDALHCQMTASGRPVFHNTIRFVVDPPGAGTCVDS